MSQLDIYFPTTDLTEAELKQRQIKAGSQNDKVLKFFEAHPDELFTPWMIADRLGLDIRSAARSVTTLTKMGYLVKTAIKRQEWRGADNFLWTLKKEL